MGPITLILYARVALNVPRLRKGVCDALFCVRHGNAIRAGGAVPNHSLGTRTAHVRPSCQRTERRLVFTRNIEPLSSERMRLPSVSSPVLTAATHKVSVAAQNAWMSMVPTFRDGFSSAAALLTSATHKVSVASQNAWVGTSTMFRGKLPSVLRAAAQHKVSIAARNAWARNITIFRGSLPSASSALLTSVRHNMSVARYKVSVAARSAWARTVAMFRGSQDEGL